MEMEMEMEMRMPGLLRVGVLDQIQGKEKRENESGLRNINQPPVGSGGGDSFDPTGMRCMLRDAEMPKTASASCLAVGTWTAEYFNQKTEYNHVMHGTVHTSTLHFSPWCAVNLKSRWTPIRSSAENLPSCPKEPNRVHGDCNKPKRQDRLRPSWSLSGGWWEQSSPGHELQARPGNPDDAAWPTEFRS